MVGGAMKQYKKEEFELNKKENPALYHITMMIASQFEQSRSFRLFMYVQILLDMLLVWLLIR